MQIINVIIGANEMKITIIIIYLIYILRVIVLYYYVQNSEGTSSQE